MSFSPFLSFFLSFSNNLYIIRKEGNVLFNDALNTFYLRLYGVGHMVKDHSDSERGNPQPPHRLFYMHHPTNIYIYILFDGWESYFQSLL